jgi:hypothetical protein
MKIQPWMAKNQTLLPELIDTPFSVKNPHRAWAECVESAREVSLCAQLLES